MKCVNCEKEKCVCYSTPRQEFWMWLTLVLFWSVVFFIFCTL